MSESQPSLRDSVAHHGKKIAGIAAAALATAGTGYGVTRGSETIRTDHASIQACGTLWDNPYKQGYTESTLPGKPANLIAQTAASVRTIHRSVQRTGGEMPAFGVVQAGNHLLNVGVRTTAQSVEIEEPDPTSPRDDLGLVTDTMVFPLSEGGTPEIAIGAVMCRGADDELYPNGTALAVSNAADLVANTQAEATGR